jgi:predicted nucleic acid-binding protein
MTTPPRRILLDTNVFIIGFLDLNSPEAQLLQRIAEDPDIILIFSNDLEEQIRRVGRRLKDKDWVGQLLSRIWHDYRLEYIYITVGEMTDVEVISDIPNEDIGIYLTALRGQADYFVSANRQLLQEAAAKQNKFECLDAEAFILRFPSESP